MLKIALPKGRLGNKVYDIFEKIGYGCDEIKSDSRKLIFTSDDNKYCFMTVKPTDVPVYIERGAADIGVAGKDVIEESGADIYELLDLDTGKCRMSVCGYKDGLDDNGHTLRVATKFPAIATAYFNSKGRKIDIIKLNGSIELAPIIGLSDVIVDIVETGSTLKENNLCVLEDICTISARLIANKSSYQFLSGEIRRITELMEGYIRDKNN